MIDRRLLRLEDVLDPDRDRHMSCPCDSDLTGRAHDRIVCRTHQAWMNLEEIIPCRLVSANEPFGSLGIGGTLTVERRRSDVHGRPQHFPIAEVGAKSELIWRTEHRTDRRYPVRDIEEHDVA